MLIKLTCQHIGLCRVDACCLLRYEEQFSTVRALQSVALSVAVRYKVLAKFAALFHVYSLISCIFSYFMYILLFHVYSLISCIFSELIGRVGWMHVAWSGMNEACPTSMSRVPHQRDLSHMNETCSISTCHVPYQCRICVILQRGHDPIHVSCTCLILCRILLWHDSFYFCRRDLSFYRSY